MTDIEADKPFKIVAASDKGNVREQNEDYFCVFDPETDEIMRSRGVLAVVSDGMGGHFSGAAASRTAVEVMGEEYFKNTDGDAVDALRWAFLTANREVYDRVGEGRNGLAGTTCTAAALFPDRLNIAHAGDSRAYLISDGEMRQLTVDHSVVGEMLRQGMLSQEEARTHPRRNVITRAVGLREEVEVDVFPGIPFQKNDTLLLCTDGLFSMIAESEIVEIVNGNPPERACADLIRRAKEQGGTDNITVVVIRKL
jgi:protein phosphatase